MKHGQLVHGTDVDEYHARHDPERPRKLLLHRKEIARISGQVTGKGLTVIPLEVYLKGNWIKARIARADTGSSPSVGSSRKSTSGELTRARAIMSRCLIPLE